jgi:ABC-type lipoprotein release transport system permease subunit
MDRTPRWLFLVPSLLLAAVTASSQSADRAAPPSILISRQLAESRHLHAGDIVQLSADRSGTNARAFLIAGVYEPTPDPMRFAQHHFEARLHLPDLLTLTGDPSDPAAAEAVTSINVALQDPSDAEAFSRDVTTRLPMVTARPVDAPDDRTTTFIVVKRFHLAIAIVTVLGSAVFLLALMLMVVDERRGTMGTLRLLGFTRQRILMQVLAEGALIATAGAVAGIAFAFAAQDVFNRIFQWRYDTTLIFLRITPAVVWRSLLMAVPLGIAASVIASWTLLRQQILALVRR